MPNRGVIQLTGSSRGAWPKFKVRRGHDVEARHGRLPRIDASQPRVYRTVQTRWTRKPITNLLWNAQKQRGPSLKTHTAVSALWHVLSM